MSTPEKKPHPDHEVVLTFTPANEGDFLSGVPRRDLTVADMRNVEPFQLRDMTVAGPSGNPMYTYVEPKLAKQQKPAEAAAPDPTPTAETLADKTAGKTAGKDAN